MGARRRRLNKERIGIFDLYSGSADEETGEPPSLVPKPSSPEPYTLHSKTLNPNEPEPL